MQTFILTILVLGLAFFLYLLQIGEIDQNSFNVSRFKSDIYLDVRKNSNELNTKLKTFDIYAVINKKDYEIFNFKGDDFKKLIKAEYVLPEYSVPTEAKSAVSVKSLGNRYVFYIIDKTDKEKDNQKIYEIYKTENPTDYSGKLKYFLIKTITDSETRENVVEVKY